MEQPRQRTRTSPPVIPVVPPVPRMRVRSIPVPIHLEGEPPPKHWRGPATVPDNMPRQEVCTLGEIDIKRRPSQWAGWPNGSLVMYAGGQAQKGRVIQTDTNKYHVLLWNRARSCYVYMRLVKTHAEAITAL